MAQDFKEFEDIGKKEKKIDSDDEDDNIIDLLGMDVSDEEAKQPEPLQPK